MHRMEAEASRLRFIDAQAVRPDPPEGPVSETTSTARPPFTEDEKGDGEMASFESMLQEYLKCQLTSFYLEHQLTSAQSVDQVPQTAIRMVRHPSPNSTPRNMYTTYTTVISVRPSLPPLSV